MLELHACVSIPNKTPIILVDTDFSKMKLFGRYTVVMVV